MRLVCGDNNSFQQSEYNLKIANLCRFSHLQPFRLLLGSFMGTGRNFNSRELGFFQVFSYLSCREIQIGKKRKEKKEKIKRRRIRKKEKKRGKEEERKTKKFSFIYFCQVSCKVNESSRPKGRKLEKWQSFCLLVFQSFVSRSRVDFNSTFKHSTISTVKSSVFCFFFFT